MVEYYLQNDIQQKGSEIEKLKNLADILSACGDKLGQLAAKATVRKSQLFLYKLASQTHSCYTALVAEIQQIENKVLQSYKRQFFSDEWRVIPFASLNKQDNSYEIFIQCKRLGLLIQDAYNELFKNDFLSEAYKTSLKYQLDGLLTSFSKLATD
jgi:hypothetical protein